MLIQDTRLMAEFYFKPLKLHITVMGYGPTFRKILRSNQLLLKIFAVCIFLNLTYILYNIFYKKSKKIFYSNRLFNKIYMIIQYKRVVQYDILNIT